MRIEHTKDCLFARMNHVKVFRNREDETEYEHSHISTDIDKVANRFVEANIQWSFKNNIDVIYNLSFLTDAE